jgi:hypothetical protein
VHDVSGVVVARWWPARQTGWPVAVLFREAKRRRREISEIDGLPGRLA